MSAVIEPGTYDAVTTAATIHEAPSGAVMCRIGINIEGILLTGGICLVQKDGTLSERGFKDVQTIFGWSDWNWAKWEFDPETFAGHAVQAVVETVQGERGEFSSVKYINPPGGGRQTLEKADSKILEAKYGAKTRALFGGAPGAASRPPPKPPAVTKPKPPTANDTPPSSMEKCWDEFCKEHAGKQEPQLYELWPKLLARVHPNKNQNDLTPAEWGAVYATFNLLPY